MMVLFVSRSEKKAIKTTDMVLDAFANRIGDSTWQTVITQEGLETVRKLLRKSASKNTSVSCHWMRSRSVCQLLWIVGNKTKFGENGVVPVNSTCRNILSNYREFGWNFLPMIQALTAVAALLHDLGKASVYFQNKLCNKSHKADPFRHELVSALLIQALYRYYSAQEKDLWEMLASGELPDVVKIIPYCRDQKYERLVQYKPFKDNTSVVLYCVLWLVLCHHRLPLPLNSQGETATYNNFSEGAKNISDLFGYITSGFTYRRFTDKASLESDEFSSDLDKCFTFISCYGQFNEKWFNELKKWSGRLRDVIPQIELCSKDGTLRAVLKYARLSLMLGDHFYSSQPADSSWKSECSLYANTDHGLGTFRQKLDEHLCGVKSSALKVLHYLPFLEEDLPQTGVIKELKRKSEGRFAWQDTAVETIGKFSETNPEIQGTFILNLAGTGCGKTTANAKIASVFGKERGMLRFTLALGLRTLTLQTGDEYRSRLHLTDEDLAVVIGSSSVQYLHDQDQRLHGSDSQAEENNYGGSESIDELFTSDTVFEGELPQEGFATLFEKPNATKMLYAPVLCCTIDQMIAATECCKGGRYMLPLMRLMSSDLIIDEVDDFTGDDLKAIGRLIYLCGTLGRRVILSSATIPPEIAAGFFFAYKEGFKSYCALRNKKNDIMLAWLNENECKTELFSIDNSKNFMLMHKDFTDRQVARLKKSETTKLGYICNCTRDNKACDRSSVYFQLMLASALTLHDNHHLIDPKSGKEVSFGVIRLANIDPCVAVAKYLCSCQLSEGIELRVTAYHSRQPLLLRHEQERYLDALLKRRGEDPADPAILDNPLVRKLIDYSNAKKLLFVVVCSPVEEVGRDHDYDWAVIEPSSWRSIVQMSGRVNRHRNYEVKKPNISVMSCNCRCFKNEDRKDPDGSLHLFYTKPGYELKDPAMPSHDLRELLNSWDGTIDASERLTRDAKGKNMLALYEHNVLKKELFSQTSDSMLKYPLEYWDLSAVAQNLSRFRNSQPSVDLTLRIDNKDSDEFGFFIKDRDKNWARVEKIYEITIVSSQDFELCRNRIWIDRNYINSAEQYASISGISCKEEVMNRFGEVAIPDYGVQNIRWKYSDLFGLYKDFEE